MTVLIDSWSWIEYLGGTGAGKKVEEILESEEEKIISAINVAEVYRHVLKGKGDKEARDALKFMLDASFAVPVQTDIAVLAAKMKHEKRVGLADAIVMATAALHSAKILTGDPDFKSESNVIYLGK